MSDAKGKPMATVPVDAAKGNALFEKAVVAIGLDDTTTRWLCVSVLNTISRRSVSGLRLWRLVHDSFSRTKSEQGDHRVRGRHPPTATSCFVARPGRASTP